MIRSLIASSSKGLRRNLLSSSRRRNYPSTESSAAAATLRVYSAAAVSNVSVPNLPRDADDKSWLFFLMAAGVVSSTAMITRLEEEEEDGESAVSEDPYDNLPEEDEPTHCSICLTYRQGPCRPYWRKVEACTKDNELKKEEEPKDKNDEEDDKTEEGEQPDPPCMKYMLPWIECATGFRNLYTLIELDTNYTIGIADLEKEAKETLCWAPGKEPKIDWSAWKMYVLAHDEWKLPPKKMTGNAKSAGISLWKTLDQSQDPELIEIETQVPSVEGDGILECAYALDQDGNVLGFSYGTKPSEAAKKETTDNEDDNPMVDLKIRLLPTHTRRIMVKASYTQPKKEGVAEDAPLDAHIYQSKFYSLKKMAKQE